MHRIEIKSFGPLMEANIDITDIVFLLGEQASGKSTITKIIYFFKTLREEFINTILTNGIENWEGFQKAYATLLYESQ